MAEHVAWVICTVHGMPPSMSYGPSVIPQGVPVIPPGVLFMAKFANLLPLAASTIPPTPMGI